MADLRRKDKMLALVLAFFLGGFGAHKFYLGRTSSGIIYLLFCWSGVPVLLAVCDIVRIAYMDQGEFDREYNGQ